MSWVGMLGFAISRPVLFLGLAGPDFSLMDRVGPDFRLGLRPRVVALWHKYVWRYTWG